MGINRCIVYLQQTPRDSASGNALHLLRLANPGRFAPITCSPRKVSRFASLNRYYIMIDEVFFDNFLVIMYLLVVCKKKFLHFDLLLSKISSETFLAKFTKNHMRTVKEVFFFCTNAKMHEMTKMLYKCANNLLFNELRIKC
jgi:hypothetical protein